MVGSERDITETGLPGLERAWLSGLLRLGSAVTGPRTLLNRFAREANRILEIVDDADYDIASQQARIPRMVGIEHSSCNWSLFMVLDHLIRTDRAILEIISMLREGYVPLRPVAIADFKPDQDADSSAIETFQAVARDFQQKVFSLIPLRTMARFPHPWFGPLDAHGWTALAAAHHRVHRKQARKIVAVLGVV